MAGTIEDELSMMMDEDDEEPTTSSKGPTTSTTNTTTTTSSNNNDSKKKYNLSKELRCMMYGFGDDKVPYKESVDLLEQIAVDYIQRMTMKAYETGKSGKVTVEDVWYLIRRDHKKYGRVKDLLAMQQELKKARKAFEDKY